MTGLARDPHKLAPDEKLGAEGPAGGLRIVDDLGLDDFRYLHSTRAELLRRLGRTDEARAAYRRARALTDDGPERRFLDAG